MLQQLLMNREDFLKTVERRKRRARDVGVWRPREAKLGPGQCEASRTSAPEGWPIHCWADASPPLIGRSGARAEGSPECRVPTGDQPLGRGSGDRGTVPVVALTTLPTAGT